MCTFLLQIVALWDMAQMHSDAFWDLWYWYIVNLALIRLVCGEARIYDSDKSNVTVGAYCGCSCATTTSGDTGRGQWRGVDADKGPRGPETKWWVFIRIHCTTRGPKIEKIAFQNELHWVWVLTVLKCNRKPDCLGPFLEIWMNFNSCTVGFWVWKSYFIPHFMMNEISYPYCG